MLLVVTTHDLDRLDAQIDQTEDIVSRRADIRHNDHLRRQLKTREPRELLIEAVHSLPSPCRYATRAFVAAARHMRHRLNLTLAFHQSVFPQRPDHSWHDDAFEDYDLIESCLGYGLSLSETASGTKMSNESAATKKRHQHSHEKLIENEYVSSEEIMRVHGLNVIDGHPVPKLSSLGYTRDPRHLVRTGDARLTYIEDTHSALRSLTRASLGMCQIARKSNDIVAITDIIALNESGDAGLLTLQNKQRADRITKKLLSDVRDISQKARHLHARGFENHHTL